MSKSSVSRGLKGVGWLLVCLVLFVFGSLPVLFAVGTLLSLVQEDVRWLLVCPVLFVFGSLPVLYGVGTLLSLVQVRRLSAVDAHLLRDEETLWEKCIDRLYNALLWYGSVLFYISLPVTLAFSVVTGGAIVYGLCQLPWIPLKLVFLSLAASVGGFISVIRGLFASEKKEKKGRVLTEAEAPRLFAALAEVAQVARSPMVDKVYLEPEANIGVRQEGGRFRVLLGGGSRILHLGFAALRGLSVSELKAILAHEYGHFSHGETRLTPLIGRIQFSVLRTLQSMTEVGRLMHINPMVWFLRMYLPVYVKVTRGHSRRCELLADRAAALAYGGETFASALTRVIHNAALFERASFETLQLLIQTGHYCRNLYPCLDAADAQTPGSLRQLRARRLANREQQQYDSHPPPHDRISRVVRIPAQRPLERAPALTLFKEPDALGEEFTRQLSHRVEHTLMQRGFDLPPVRDAVKPAQQEQFASALWCYRDALELREHADPEADRAIVASARKLEELGEADPFLVPVLQEMAQAQCRMGDLPAAHSSLQRAIGLLEAMPRRDQELIDSLTRELANVGQKAA